MACHAEETDLSFDEWFHNQPNYVNYARNTTLTRLSTAIFTTETRLSRSGVSPAVLPSSNSKINLETLVGSIKAELCVLVGQPDPKSD